MKTWETKSGQKITQILSGRSNVFLLTKGEKQILIDTSPGFMWGLLRKRLSELNINHLDYLILTHAHFDHAANAQRIKEFYKPSVIIHRSEAENLANGVNTITSGTNIIYRFLTKFMATSWMTLLNYEPCSYDYTVDTEFDLSGMGFNAFILHTPGHTKGSISVIVDNEIAIVGDCMFGVYKSSVFPPVAEDPKEMIKSWRKLLETDCQVFIPSHGSAGKRSLVQKEYDKRKR
jgi:glyoxylase-like metal-dependent hydrolase (beta-lactamase superfamily II)